MSDRKYRQRGYQDDGERPERSPSGPKKTKPPGAPRTVISMSREGPRSPVMPARRGVSRCAGCGALLSPDIDTQARCPKCGFELHSCKQCANFDTGQRFECLKPIPARIAKKDAKNDCTFFVMKVTLEKETSSAAAVATPAAPAVRPSAARQAFEDLFRK
jgi:predicted RNA-binding Zn-ribbon protein involved in translation (DUF1610 family)